jgi:hypothetical protein
MVLVLTCAGRKGAKRPVCWPDDHVDTVLIQSIVKVLRDASDVLHHDLALTRRLVVSERAINTCLVGIFYSHYY